MKELIGVVTEEEKNEIRFLFEHKNSLKELAMVLDTNDKDLFRKMQKDILNTDVKYQQWWNEMSRKYKWNEVSDAKWIIDFKTCEIFLSDNI